MTSKRLFELLVAVMIGCSIAVIHNEYNKTASNKAVEVEPGFGVSELEDELTSIQDKMMILRD